FPGWALLAGAQLTLGLVAVAVALPVGLVAALNGPGLPQPGGLAGRVATGRVVAAVVVVLTLALAPVAAFLAPRGPSGLGMTLASLTTFALCGLLALAGLWATWTRSQSVTRTAMT